MEANVANEEDVQKYVQYTKDTFGKIDGFFNNAGVEGKQNLTEDYGIEEFQKVVDINLNGVFYGMKHVLKIMKEQGFGSIVNTASVGGIRGVGNQSGYAASKHGVVGLTKNSGIEYGQFGVSIKAIAPGAIMTAMVEGSLRQIGEITGKKQGKNSLKRTRCSALVNLKKLATSLLSYCRTKQTLLMQPLFRLMVVSPISINDENY